VLWLVIELMICAMDDPLDRWSSSHRLLCCFSRLPTKRQVWSNQEMQKVLALLFAVLIVSTAQALPAPPVDLACRWSAQLTAALPGVSESYSVPFDLLIEHVPGGLGAALLNGSNHIDFSSAVQREDEVTLRLDQYDATLTAHCTHQTSKCTEMIGEYVRQKGTSASHLAISAKCDPSFASPEAAKHSKFEDPIVGDWQFAFADSAGKPDAEGIASAHFSERLGHLEGTIAPISGDYGMLSNSLFSGDKDEAFHLSRFDGIHALRLDGHLVSPGRMEGIFHVAPGHPLTFVATRTGASKGFDEAEHLTSVADPPEAFHFHGLDDAGAMVNEQDPRFRNKVVLLDVFGTWCPNCHDEAPVLQSLYAEFHKRGLEIVGLSYEYVDDRARSLRLIDVYRHKYGIGFPLLLVGTTDPGQIEKTLPQLRNFGAYPTTIFLDRHGRVRLIHAGFSGPATGRLDEVRQNFERTIVKLLDEQ
jgi:thiol-disulfide isomerase/thioredoxin